VLAEMQACAAHKSSLSRRMSTDAALEEIARADRSGFVPASCPV
jgi:hypothetical protein